MTHLSEVTLPELVDLALCSPEIGAVNFNILRIVLHEIISKLGLQHDTAKLSELETGQVQNFRNYIEGAGTSSPMPGVLKIGPGGTSKQMGGNTPRVQELQKQHGDSPRNQTPGSAPPTVQVTPQSKPPSAPGQAQTQGPQQHHAEGQTHGQTLEPPHPTQHQPQGGESGHDGKGKKNGYYSSGNIYTAGDNTSEPVMQLPISSRVSPLNNVQGHHSIESKVARLEKHLEALYALPTNSTLLGSSSKEETTGAEKMTVNDMWQMIQLNNRVAASEAAIQKMASLIEDLAKQVKLLKMDAKGVKSEGKELARTSSKLSMQMEPCMEKCEKAINDLKTLRMDLEKIKAHLTSEIEKLSLAAGIDPGRTPSFMQPKEVSPVVSVASHGKRGSRDGQTHTEHSSSSKSTSKQGGEATRGSQSEGGRGSFQGTTTDGGKGHRSDSQGKGGIRGSVTEDSHDSTLHHHSSKPGSSEHHESHSGSGGAHSGPGSRGSHGSGEHSSEEMRDGEKSKGSSPLHPPSGGGSSGGEGSGGRGSRSGESGGGGSGPHSAAHSGDGKGESRGSGGIGGGGEEGGEGEGGEDGEFYDEVGENRQERATSMNPNDPGYPHHGSVGAEVKLEDSHPDKRHQHDLSHVPVDVVGGDLTGEEVLDRIDPFHAYKAPSFDDGATLQSSGADADWMESCKNQAEMVQKELQEQYGKLQEIQRHMAMEIQDKMEIVYQKLLKEITAQSAETSPYMAVGLNADKCLGPGICTGFGLPTGTAVCQFPQKPDKVDVCAKEPSVCPGRNICPGKEVCPTCKDDILHHLKVPGGKKYEYEFEPKTHLSSSQENLLRQLTSMTLLPRDLNELRDRVKEHGRIPEVFDELDVLEKLQTLWEAVNVLKTNEENMAVRIVQQDAMLKKLPEDAGEKLHKISTESLDAINKGVESSGTSQNFGKGQKGGGGGGGNLGSEDVQIIFNNLSSLVLENSGMKEKLQKIGETILEFEQNMVTKPMLINAMSDKADRGQMNTKVSYDEFGAGMDELQSRLQNLLLEVYKKNELWKELTDQLKEEVGDKLDKVEMGPLRAYFKNHLGKLEDKVNYLTKIMDEPDPAGTRKKLLKDYNCISCDRHTNISGLTNSPMIPVLGPIRAGHSTASQRAFELYRMRPKTSRYDATGRNLCMMEREGQGDCRPTSLQGLNDSDVMHLVNRYVGGSHTSMSPADRIAALHKRASVKSQVQQHQHHQQSVTSAPIPSQPVLPELIARNSQIYDE